MPRFSYRLEMAESISEATCVVRGTGDARGRARIFAPGTSPARWLHCARIVLDPSGAPLSFSNPGQETGLIALGGAARIRAGQSSYELKPYDSLYVTRDAQIEIEPGAEGCGLVEFSAPVDGFYPMQFVRFADVQRDPSLQFLTGGPAADRQVTMLLAKNIEAGRIIGGLTVSRPGNWTSWPPHEHAAMLEEAYLFIDMPAPAWGVQFVYTNPLAPELVTTVRDGDCVLMPEGYHPNLAAPGACLKFLWLMAAQREREDRRFGVVNVQPEYAATPSGLERGR